MFFWSAGFLVESSPSLSLLLSTSLSCVPFIPHLFSHWSPSSHTTFFPCLSSFSPHFPDDFVLFTFHCFFQSTPFPSHPPSPSPVNSFHLSNPSFSSSLPCFSFTFPISTSLLPELQFMVEHHLYRQQQGAGDECSSESCLSDRPSPDSVPTGEELPHDDEATAEAFEKLRCQMEGMLGDCKEEDFICMLYLLCIHGVVLSFHVYVHVYLL